MEIVNNILPTFLAALVLHVYYLFLQRSRRLPTASAPPHIAHNAQCPPYDLQQIFSKEDLCFFEQLKKSFLLNESIDSRIWTPLSTKTYSNVTFTQYRNAVNARSYLYDLYIPSSLETISNLKMSLSQSLSSFFQVLTLLIDKPDLQAYYLETFPILNFNSRNSLIYCYSPPKTNSEPYLCLLAKSVNDPYFVSGSLKHLNLEFFTLLGNNLPLNDNLPSSRILFTFSLDTLGNKLADSCAKSYLHRTISNFIQDFSKRLNPSNLHSPNSLLTSSPNKSYLPSSSVVYKLIKRIPWILLTLLMAYFFNNCLKRKKR